jgi:hypothetical protein
LAARRERGSEAGAERFAAVRLHERGNAGANVG